MDPVDQQPRRNNEYNVPGFQAMDPHTIDQVCQNQGSLHLWGGVNIVKLSPEMVVKFGSHVSIIEAETMLYVARNTQKLPVPKVFGYYSYGPYQRDIGDHGSLYDTYIFMSFIDGESLDKAWESYDEPTKSSVTSQLKAHLNELRSIPSATYIGSVNRGPVTDQILERSPSQGPYDTEEDFNSAVIDAYQRASPKVHIRSFLEGMLSHKKHCIMFTHGDLRHANIMVKDGKVTGIVDWELGGWYPEYWEFTKALYIWQWQNDWTDYLLKILEPYYPEYGVHSFIAQTVW